MVPPRVLGLFLTYPQCPHSKEELLSHLQSIDVVREYCICTELHLDGKSHLHAWVKFETGLYPKQYTPTLDLLGFHGNYQSARSRKCVLQYVKKGGDFITNVDDAAVTCPQTKRAKIALELTNRPVAEMILDGTIPYQSARAALFAQSLLQTPYDHDSVRGVWIHGPSGTGKSHAARNNYGSSFFLKPQNKWFDGYVGQATIVLDDYDCGATLGHHLKIWMDRYACTGEIKGGVTQLRHTKFVVTSNFSILQSFGTPTDNGYIENETVRAITRRCEVIYLATCDYTIPTASAGVDVE